MPHDVGMIRVMEAFFASPDEGGRLDTALRSHRLLAQFPDLEVIDSVFEPGWEGVDPHVHDDHTDSFYVLEGEVEFFVNGEWRRGGQGRSSPRRPASHMVSASPASSQSACSMCTRRTLASSAECALDETFVTLVGLQPRRSPGPVFAIDVD
jgi:hypothetical protein